MKTGSEIFLPFTVTCTCKGTTTGHGLCDYMILHSPTSPHLAREFKSSLGVPSQLMAALEGAVKQRTKANHLTHFLISHFTSTIRVRNLGHWMIAFDA